MKLAVDEMEEVESDFRIAYRRAEAVVGIVDDEKNSCGQTR